MTDASDHIGEFIARWGDSSGGERSNWQSFLKELCTLLELPQPDPSVEDLSQNAYVFERTVTRRRHEGRDTPNFIDLYKRGSFVMEAKQSKKRQKQIAGLTQPGFDLGEQRTGSGKRGGATWDILMKNAREQAEGYARALPHEEGWPPFIAVVDVGHVIELYADFSLQGKHYAQFPDRRSYRIYLEDLHDEAVRERLRLLWTDPQALNPAARTAAVTREVAALLAHLSKSMETRMIRALPEKGTPEKQAADRHLVIEKVAMFLMRCLFTMFAEDVGLLKRDSFSEMLEDYRDQPDKVHFGLESLWQKMNKGGFSPELKLDVLRFNGGLFRDATALPVTAEELDQLAIAARRDWKDVEPAIFGTLLESALTPADRHKLGAHYTPRAYVERLVVATVIEPLTDDWRNVQAAAAQLLEEARSKQVEAKTLQDDAGKLLKAGNETKARDLGEKARKLLSLANGHRDKGRATVRAFHELICSTRVLDPACGTGNFLYVSMELMKRLEGEVLEALADMGVDIKLELDHHTVDPHQFLGLEINPRAVAIAELVLWIGYLQWHFRTRGESLPAEPVLRNFHNIEEKDAVITWESQGVLRDETGRPVTRWDGVTVKLHPITGEEVPDEAARVEMKTYLNPKPATWPEADFIVGNPPFIGNKRMIDELGEGYTEAVRNAHSKVPKSVDFVMYWWHMAASLVQLGKARRFGLITTNSITQSFNKRVVEQHLASVKTPVSITFGTANHPWLKSTDKAAVRISMTCGEIGDKSGLLLTPKSETKLDTDSPEIIYDLTVGKINPDLTIGVDVHAAKLLASNRGLAHQGVIPVGTGFRLTPTELVALGYKPNSLPNVVRPYKIGRDLTQRPETRFIIDFYGLTENEVATAYPKLYQLTLDKVRPVRNELRRKAHRDKWWIYGEPRSEMRKALSSLDHYISTCRTSKHRMFQIESSSVLPDAKIICIALSDLFFIGVLSSRSHVLFSEKIGARLGVGDDPNYNHSDCFGKFPFPDPSEVLKDRIRDLGERLDAHRKEVLEKHKHLTMTGLYNVLEKVRAGEALTDAERDVYDAGLVGVLRQIHDDLDAAVAAAYGWPADLSDEEILERLVALNSERAAEEAEGNIRWLRPEFQAPKEAAARKPKQMEADLLAPAEGEKKPSLPTALPDQVAAIRAALAAADTPATPAAIARRFKQGKSAVARVEEVLRTLTLLGQAEQVGEGYVLSG